MKLLINSKAKLACLYAGAVWGLFWIPLRALEDAGLHGLWITVVYFLVPTLCLVPIGIWRWKYFKSGGLQLQITAMVSGGALLLYSSSIVYTDVVRAMLLFYLTPIWGTILARIFLKDAITPLRIFAMIIAVVGMLTIFGLGVQFPVPQNAGDWMGVASGILWAIAMVRIRVNQEFSAIEMTLGFFFWSLSLFIDGSAVSCPVLYSFDCANASCNAITTNLYGVTYSARHLCVPLGAKVPKSRCGRLVIYDRNCDWVDFRSTTSWRTFWYSRNSRCYLDYERKPSRARYWSFVHAAEIRC